jgi:hypothetical protein
MIVFLGSASPAFARPTCREWANGMSAKIREYLVEVANTRGRRVFLKDSKPTLQDSRWAGVFRYSEPRTRKSITGKRSSQIANAIPSVISRSLFKDPNYRFTPFAALYDATIRSPVHMATGRWGPRQLELTSVSHFIVSSALGMLGYTAIDSAYAKSLEAHINSTIEASHEDYSWLIENDYRFTEVKRDREKGEMTPGQLDQEAYRINLAYNQYYSYRQSNPSDGTLEAEMKLSQHYLFFDLLGVIEDGITNKPGFFIPESAKGSISETQAIALFESHHRLYLEYEIVAELSKNITRFDHSANADLHAMLLEIQDHDFYRHLLNLKNKKQIDEGQFRSLVQEDCYWRAKFREWAIVGVQKLKKQDGQYTNTPLLIDDIRTEILAGLELH